MKRALLLLMIAFCASPLAAVTRRNDDSCDIAQLPAATLLLPYFEVHLEAPRAQARTTLFTITNTVREPQIAHITLWTDYGYPVLAWNAVLTGYDVYPVDLRDVLEGRIVSTPDTPRGARSLGANPKADTSACANTPLSPEALDAVRMALTRGHSDACGISRIGGIHTFANGYVTIDVVSSCTSRFHTDSAYAGDLLYDNVLTGDYMIVDSNPATGNYAGASPMVHVRAVPEGSGATNLEETFYRRLMSDSAPLADRRQPLPSRFVSRMIFGGATAFTTDLQIWRGAAATPACSAFTSGYLSVRETVAFDERENPYVLVRECPFTCPVLDQILPAASRVAATSSELPAVTSGDVGGWLYLDLDTETPSGPRPMQAWVTTVMFAEGRYMTAQDATALGNGCSPRAGESEVTPIAPAP